MKDPTSDYWQLKYKNIPIWAYFRLEYNGSNTARYKKHLTLNMSDILSLTRFLFLPLSDTKNLIFIANRIDLVRFSESLMADGESYKLFTRSDSFKGNSTLIEAIWFVFRKLSWIVKYQSYKNILLELSKFDNEWKWNKNDVKAAIGDYHYNYFLRFFLQNKTIYYSNCVIPKIERYMGLHSSKEVQHGIIYANHLDYKKVPAKLLKSKIVVWNSYWKEKLRNDCLYEGVIESGNFDFYVEPSSDIDKFWLTIFSTVDDEVSKKIDCYSGESKIYLQKHPRDYFKYKNVSENFFKISGGAEYKTQYAIVYDSTLILSFAKNGVYFFYLKKDQEKSDEIKLRLFKKYNVDFHKHYSIVSSIDEAITLLGEMG